MLGEATPDWSPAALFGGRGYSLARAMFRRGAAPWGDTCRRCCALQPGAPFAHDRPGKRLRQFLVEPSFACTLRCPSCPRREVAQTRSGSVFLPVETWRHVLGRLRDEGYAIETFLTTGLGDPLLHPRLEDLIAAAREFFPTTPITVNTNGNYRFADVFPRGIHPDRLLVSVDGLHQESYVQYRINGDVATALAFMRDARRQRGRRPAVEWKYILFRHNDSDAELAAAQQTAAEFDLDSLQFVFTHTREKSLRYTAENAHELPIVWSGAYPEATAQQHFRRDEIAPLSPASSDAHRTFPGRARVRLQVDSCQRWSDRLLLRGWAMGFDGSPPHRIALRVNGEPAGQARSGLVREDVWHAFPAFGNREAGFDVMGALPAAAATSITTVVLAYETPAGETYPFQLDYDLRPTAAKKIEEATALQPSARRWPSEAPAPR